MAYRPDWWPRHASGDVVGVLGLAMALHRHTTGSQDPLEPDTLATVVKCLEHADANWKTSPPWSADFDNAVRQVIRSALADYKRKAKAA